MLSEDVPTYAGDQERDSREIVVIPASTTGEGTRGEPEASVLSRDRVDCSSENEVEISAGAQGAYSVPSGMLRGLTAPRPSPRTGADEARVGGRLAQFDLVEVLGQGGWGVVYRAIDRKLKRVVALKLLHSRGPESRAALLREARRAAAVRHPNVVQVFDVNEDIGFIFMEFIDGLPLRRLLEQRTLSLAEALDLARQIASGLAHAHELGIVHRDLTPGNVMVCTKGRVKILDFGLAKQLGSAVDEEPQGISQLSSGTTARTVDGKAVGTKGYMAPEQEANGGAADARSDVFAFGILLRQMLNAVPADDVIEATRVPIEAIVDRCLRHDPEDRFVDAGALGHALASVDLPSSSAPARSSTLSESVLPVLLASAPSAAPARGRVGVVAVAAVATSAALVGALGLYTYARRQPADTTSPAVIQSVSAFAPVVSPALPPGAARGPANSDVQAPPSPAPSPSVSSAPAPRPAAPPGSPAAPAGSSGRGHPRGDVDPRNPF